MNTTAEKNNIIRDLEREILSLQGLVKRSGTHPLDIGLGSIENAFPNQTFPVAAMHEFISYSREEAAATNGFIGGLLGKLMHHGGACLWIGNKRTIFPAGLKNFGIDPERIIFIDLIKPKDILWTVEEALKCSALAAVVGELTELNFKESRRLQLAVEQSRVTGLLHRYNPLVENTVACVSRWKIQPMVSEAADGMPGVGWPRWNVQLQKIRNGKPGSWQVEWTSEGFSVKSRPLMRFEKFELLQTG
ncbi:Error-prone repair protein ImuA [Danxiaibacter flavus]|uniref:Error-prone repair protein ImuA n=1 Tax=Danxiaibacter flavus TaxID=3049108 RepID=A0ABV3ZAW0_9BACT|nr:Error-prone repair protein ImuA [Chitinophagaceae bacterium DXS]